MSNLSYFKMIPKTFFHLFCFSAAAFLVNFFLSQHFIPSNVLVEFHYSIPLLYLVFAVFSFAILSILLFVRSRNLDYVGYTYLILTSVKMGIAFFLLKSILNSSAKETSLEKTNFFIVFIYFLAIETLLTIRILNNKQ